MSKLQTEAATRWAGALAALVAASALMPTLLPASAADEARAEVALALHAVLQLGCAAVLLSTARGAAVAAADDLGVGGASGTRLLRWLGFACVAAVVYVAGDVAPAAEAEAAALDAVRGFLLFLVLLAGVWAVYLSFVVRGRCGGAAPPAAAAAAAEEDP